jgi:hypothetical protein
MPSTTNVVNYSLRHNKSIERAIVFDCVRVVLRELGIADAVYIGFGSVWFSDFLLAHRMLGVQRMVSIEADPVTYKRAVFNRPYRTLEVVEGESNDITPQLLDRPDLVDRPWIIWLDYDKILDTTKLEELTELVRRLPSNSVLLTTFSAFGRKYRNPERVRTLFGLAAPESISQRDFNDEDALMNILAKALEDLLVSTAVKAARRGSFVPTFRLLYRDTTPMVTLGGVLPSGANEEMIRTIVSDTGWGGQPADTIEAPPLTAKEVLALQSQLPNSKRLTRSDVEALGFDLEDAQLRSFVDHYLNYPSFVQVARLQGYSPFASPQSVVCAVLAGGLLPRSGRSGAFVAS